MVGRGTSNQVLFQIGQWAVTDWGLESVRPYAPFEYNIAAERLLEKQAAGDGKFYDWPIQMAEKTWVDMNSFSEAFRKAIEVHVGKYKGEVDQALLEQSFKEAQRRTKIGAPVSSSKPNACLGTKHSPA